MGIHKVRIIQTTRVERSIVVEVEANSIEEAVDMQSGNAAPELCDPRWIIDGDELEDEEVEPA